MTIFNFFSNLWSSKFINFTLNFHLLFVKYLSPTLFLRQNLVALKNSQFQGFAQHDAQEFLAFLLDGLHEVCLLFSLVLGTTSYAKNQYTTENWLKVAKYIILRRYSDPCILRPPVQPWEYGFKLKVVLKWRDIIYIENITVVLRDG